MSLLPVQYRNQGYALPALHVGAQISRPVYAVRRLACLRVILICLTTGLPLAACDVYSVSRSDQALGTTLGVDAWLDPQLEPLTGCSALTGSWTNRGNKVRSRTVDPSVFAAAVGIADELPDSVFAEDMRLAYTSDAGLSITLLNAGAQIAAIQIPSTAIDCRDSTTAVLQYNGASGLSVDATGALWVGEHRYTKTGATVCERVGFWTHSAPNGMATVITGGTALLLEPADPESPIRVRAPAHGVRESPAAIYLLPGEQKLSARVSFQPESQWTMSVPFAKAEFSARLEACHVYAVIGLSDSTDTASLSFVDLGTHFDWRDCHTGENPYSNIQIDAQKLTARESCFQYGGDWRAAEAAPARVFAISPLITLRREPDGSVR